MTRSWVRMGVVHAHGLRGELKLVLDNESSTLRWVGLSVRVASKDGATHSETRITRFRRSGPLGILSLEGVGDRNAAEAIAGSVLSVDRSDLPELGEDEVYLTDLEGLAVEEGGTTIGRVARVEIYPSSSAAVVSIDGQEIEVPLHEPYVVEVDLRARVLRVALLDELRAPVTRDPGESAD